jgi:hypothetical protein
VPKLAHRHGSVTAPIRPVQKSPSLTVVEDWLSTVVFTVALAVSKTMCFQTRVEGAFPVPCSGWSWWSAGRIGREGFQNPAFGDRAAATLPDHGFQFSAQC